MQLVRKTYYAWTRKYISEYPFTGQYVSIPPDKNANHAKKEFLKKYWYDLDNEGYIDVRVKRAPQYDVFLSEGREVTKEKIEYEKRIKEWREEMISLVENNKDKQCYIYSGQWGAYWRAEGKGYTDKKEEAGIYSPEDAWSRISHCDLGKKVRIIII